MIFRETEISGARVVEVERLEDERGFFARTWCSSEFQDAGLSPRLVQCSLSFNRERGTLRGLHYQAAPYREAKLVRCTMGSIHDVIVDLRADSPTYLEHVSAVLTAENRLAIYVPEGCAHGFQTLEDDTEVFYQMTEFYESSAGRGVRWDDPALRIEWPLEPTVISERDRGYPDVDRSSTVGESS
ncbi:MAG: dTDP-4-dehydrorhamnose 3,5-epimerase [Candidatus Palauibacterales bacterium]|nr:dTDP-4-dehydrorhamnose 3,5-epimerase [Candidatus Palauibacterales bacterium]MDP2529735.1 dTDP-4-dehydrorhamnose 3,5-epimerase [Candidatus Palauibacterales bacterium]MDP2583159.1 dTDP-4-dehydrorhamnose 3,5-epimerase [Candidatus Palauibacterales bacterium]